MLNDVHGLPSASHLLHAGRSCRRPAAGWPACRPAAAPSRRRADEVGASPALEGGNDDQLIDEPMMFPPDWENVPNRFRIVVTAVLASGRRRGLLPAARIAQASNDTRHAAALLLPPPQTLWFTRTSNPCSDCRGNLPPEPRRERVVLAFHAGDACSTSKSMHARSRHVRALYPHGLAVRLSSTNHNLWAAARGFRTQCPHVRLSE